MTIPPQYRNRYSYCYAALLFISIAFFATILDAAESTEKRPQKVKFELRLASHEPIKGWESVASDVPGQTIWISPKASITNADVAQASPEQIDDKNFVIVQFTENGALNFARTTKAHIGSFLAILIDGRVIAAPKIMTEITGGRAMLTGNLTEEEARSIAAGITVRQNSTEENNKK
jgi:preprotein translocase subunit SecD